MLGADGAPKAGICHARGMNAGLPPVWLLYLPVGDLAESLRRAREEGGSVITTVQDADGQPYYAVVEDPVGVHVALIAG
jgi:predicted enzyme related to lactoylglutathione lyase